MFRYTIFVGILIGFMFSMYDEAVAEKKPDPIGDIMKNIVKYTNCEHYAKIHCNHMQPYTTMLKCYEIFFTINNQTCGSLIEDVRKEILEATDKIHSVKGDNKE